jgi:hypothetical protein
MNSIARNSNERYNINENYYNEELYYYSKPWCLGIRDYCPLVISIMSFIIIVSIFLIGLLCYKNRRFFKCFRVKSESTTSLSPRSTASTTSSFNSNQINLSRSLNVESLNAVPVWSIDMTKFTRPPPSYDESEQFQLAFNSVIPTNFEPVSAFKQFKTANINNAFSMENVEQRSFPLSIHLPNTNLLQPAVNYQHSPFVPIEQSRTSELNASSIDREPVENSHFQRNNPSNASFMSTDSFVYTCRNFQRNNTKSRKMLPRRKHRFSKFTVPNQNACGMSLNSEEFPPDYEAVISESVIQLNNHNYDILRPANTSAAIISEVEYIV